MNRRVRKSIRFHQTLLAALIACTAPVVAASERQDFELVPIWSLNSGGELLTGRINDVARHPSGLFLLLDAQLSQIHVVDAEGNWRRSLGAEGEGPGEFRRAASVFCDAVGSIVVVQSVPLRLVRFTIDGDVLDDLRFDDGRGGIRALSTMRAVDGLLVYEELETSFALGALLNTTRLASFDPSRKHRRVFAEHVHEIRLSERIVREEATSPFLGRWTVTSDRAVVHLADNSLYHARKVSLFDEDPIDVRRPEIQPPVRTAAERDRLRDERLARRGHLASGRLRYEPSATGPNLAGILAHEDGGFWLVRAAESHDRKAEATVLLCDRFDARGRLLGEVWLHGSRDLRGGALHLFGELLLVLSGPEGEEGSERSGVSAWRVRERGR